jgi:hypothetical protein
MAYGYLFPITPEAFDEFLDPFQRHSLIVKAIVRFIARFPKLF